MAQLKTLDTTYLKARNHEQHASLATGAVAIVDGAPHYDLLKTLLAERILPIPRCTQALGTQWADREGFDLTYHVQRVALTTPGDDAELFGAIAHALERPLDPDRPPWECWVIEGIKDNRWAILMKVHHRLTDGNSAAHLLTRLCDDADPDDFTDHSGAKHVSPEQGGKRFWSGALWQASSAVGAIANTLAGAIWPVPRRTPVDPVTLRRYSAVRVPIADVDGICRKFGVTADDVALAAITEGFRTVLLQRGEQPRPDSLRTLVPVRSVMLPYLPVEHSDPVQRLRTVHQRRKAGQSEQPADSLVDSALNCLPTIVRGNVLHLLSRLPQRGIVTLATNAPGPRHQLRLMGQTLERLLPIPPTAVRLSTGVAVLSYGDELVFGITAEHHAASDVNQLATGIKLEMARLVALSQDSVLLFGKDHRRRRSSRALPNRTQRARPAAPRQAGH